MRVKAFTLVELMVVMAVIAVLAALLFPVLSSVRRKAKEADSISNLKQCATAIAVYMEGDDLARLPSFENAKRLLARAPTCDREDYLRPNCSFQSSRPLIGSYAYVRGVEGWEGQDAWDGLLRETPEPYLLASVYYGDRKVLPFDGNDRNPCVGDLSCAFPTRLLRVRSDTSVQADNFGRQPEGGAGGNYLLFSWESVFTEAPSRKP